MKPTQKNVPLSDAQKLALRTAQNRLLILSSQLSDAKNRLQAELAKITSANAIDPAAFQLNDDLDLVPAVKA